MQTFIFILKESAKELRKIHTLAVTAMLTAMNTVLGLFTIMIGEFIKIGFSFLTLGLGGMLYGPVTAGILGGIGDILNYTIKPAGPFFPGFTINAILSGFIYGFYLYRKPVSIRRVFCAKLTVVIVVDLILSTMWLSMLYGQAFFALLPLRALKAAIMLPIETGILYILLSRITVIFHLGKLKNSDSAVLFKSIKNVEK